MSKRLRKEISVLAALGSVGLFLGEKKIPAALLALAAVGLRLWPASYSLTGRSVVITGGSRGLGLALAERFLKQGCRVALLARDAEELATARDILRQRTGGEALGIACDVTVAADLQRSFDEVESAWGKIDILINNAGVIVIGPFASMERDDFNGLLELQLHAVINATQLLLPRWKTTGGRIVNICSIGGKIAVPHMSSYCAAKFALAGLSQAMAVELAGQGIVVTTVFPGLMRTGSPIQAVIKGDHESEFAWFALGDTTPGLSISAEAAARRIVDAVRQGDTEVIFPSTMKLAVLAQTHFPELFSFVFQQAARFFPQGQSTVRQTGADSKQWLERQPWYALFRPIMENSKQKFNQSEKHDADAVY